MYDVLIRDELNVINCNLFGVKIGHMNWQVNRLFLFWLFGVHLFVCSNCDNTDTILIMITDRRWQEMNTDPCSWLETRLWWDLLSIGAKCQFWSHVFDLTFLKHFYRKKCTCFKGYNIWKKKCAMFFHILYSYHEPVVNELYLVTLPVNSKTVDNHVF